MHVGIACPLWRGKRSRHPRRMRIRNFTYLVRGPWEDQFVHTKVINRLSSSQHSLVSCFGSDMICMLYNIIHATLQALSSYHSGFWWPGPWFNIKISSYQYRKSYCGDKTVVRSSYLHNGISYTGKMTSLYWIRALVSIWHQDICSNQAYVDRSTNLRRTFTYWHIMGRMLRHLRDTWWWFQRKGNSRLISCLYAPSSDYIPQIRQGANTKVNSWILTFSLCLLLLFACRWTTLWSCRSSSSLFCLSGNKINNISLVINGMFWPCAFLNIAKINYAQYTKTLIMERGSCDCPNLDH